MITVLISAVCLLIGTLMGIVIGTHLAGGYQRRSRVADKITTQLATALTSIERAQAVQPAANLTQPSIVSGTAGFPVIEPQGLAQGAPVLVPVILPTGRHGFTLMSVDESGSGNIRREIGE